MSKYWVVFLMGLLSWPAFSQHHEAVQRALRNDSLLVARKKMTIQRLPLNLKEEVRKMESILKKITDESKFRGDTCGKIVPELERVKNQLFQVAVQIDKALECFDDLETAYFSLKKHIQKHPYTSPDLYRKQRRLMLSPYITAYDKQFSLIQKRERRIATRVFIYLWRHSDGECPLVTTLIKEYINEYGLRGLDSLERLEYEREVLKTEKKILTEEKIRMKNENDSLNALQVVLKDRGNQRDKTLTAKQAEIEKKQAEINDKILKSDSINREIVLLRANLLKISLESDAIRAKLDSTVRKTAQKNTEFYVLQNTVNTIKDSLHLLSDTITSKQNLLTKTQEQLENKLDLLDKRKTWIQLLGGIVLSLLLIALYIQYKRVLSARRARRNLARSNANLADANDALALANTQLKDRKEKTEHLIRELHHRTKNNLQEIGSLLYLQAHEISSPEAKEVLDEARGRIEALGIIHKQLYLNQEQRLTTVNISDYVEDLTSHLLRNNRVNQQVETHFDLEPIYVEMDFSIHIGLVINELIINSIKHAFIKHKDPKLSISIYAEDDNIHIKVKDNGPGIKPGMTWENASSFGLKLVRLLVSGREGKFRYETRNGALFHITMPLAASEFKEDYVKETNIQKT